MPASLQEMRCTAASASLPAISISPMWLTSNRPARGAHGQVLGGDAGVFDGHVPARERHHPGAGGEVAGVKRGFAKLDLNALRVRLVRSVRLVRDVRLLRGVREGHETVTVRCAPQRVKALRIVVRCQCTVHDLMDLAVNQEHRLRSPSRLC